MTTKQIEAALTEIGNYSLNKIIPLTEVAEIVMFFQESFYPDETTQVKFNTEAGKNLLEVYNGKMKDGEFVPESVPRYICPFDNIMGIYLAGPNRRKSPYKSGSSI